MARYLLLGRRAWWRLAGACASAAVVAIALGAVCVPATLAKKHAPSGKHESPMAKGHGHKQSSKPAKRAAPTGRGHAAPGKTKKPKGPKGRGHKAPAGVKKPTAPTAAPAATKPTPSVPASTQPGTTPSQTRAPAVRKRRRVVRRRAAAHRRASVRARRVSAAAGRRATRVLATGSDAAGSSGASAHSEHSRGHAAAPKQPSDKGESAVSRTVHEIVEVVPNSVKVVLAALAALSILLGAGSLFSTLRAKRLDHARRELLQEVGLLQSALLPPVPRTVGALKTSVAYRPAEGLAAGGDFYDALSLAGGRAAFILGDVSGHGRRALERTAFLRYTLRAYLEAGLEPRVALQVAGRVIDDQLGGDFATVLLAVHDPATGSLTYASAGHPAPIVVGSSAYEPVLAASSPPLGVGMRTGLRQTTVPLAPASVACLYTDGLTEARTARGILGRGRLTDLVGELGSDAEAPQLLERVAEEARYVSDDMATCLLSPTAGVTAGGFRAEQLELSSAELEGHLGERFLSGCGVTGPEAQSALHEASLLSSRFDHVILHVVFGNRRTVEVLPGNVQSIEAAARRGVAS